MNNYSLVPVDASPSPTDLPSLLTWGTLLATPRALDGNGSNGGKDADPLDFSGPSFSMPESKRRDEIGRKLGDKASRSMNERAKGFTPRHGPSSSSSVNGLRALAERTKRGTDRTPANKNSGGGSMAPPAMAPRREGLTPAGKRLLERSMGTKGNGFGGSSSTTSGSIQSGSGNRAWTPSSVIRRK